MSYIKPLVLMGGDSGIRLAGRNAYLVNMIETRYRSLIDNVVSNVQPNHPPNVTFEVLGGKKPEPQPATRPTPKDYPKKVAAFQERVDKPFLTRPKQETDNHVIEVETPSLFQEEALPTEEGRAPQWAERFSKQTLVEPKEPEPRSQQTFTLEPDEPAFAQAPVTAPPPKPPEPVYPDPVEPQIIEANEVNNTEDGVRRPSTNLDTGASVQKLVDASGLLPQYAFPTFVQGNNRLPKLSAQQAVADYIDGKLVNNPILFYGPSGLGKTHLMHAIGNELYAHNKNAKILCITAEIFVNQYIQASASNQNDMLRKFMRSLDALLIDDIQFFGVGEKRKSQEEFYHTFNSLVENGQLVVLTSNAYPREVPNLEDRIKSRLGWGLTMQLEPPDYETRRDILLYKAKRLGLNLSVECAGQIASIVYASVRELEGALNRINAHVRFRGGEINESFIREALKDMIEINNRQISIDKIQKSVCDAFNIRPQDMMGSRRDLKIATPRMMAMLLSKELTTQSYPEIALAFEKTHTTVMNACKRISGKLKTDTGLTEKYTHIKQSLQN